MDQTQKLDFMNGLKVIACFMVFSFHFINAFYCGFYSLVASDFHTQFVEHFVGSTPLNMVMNGKLGARMFLVISGFFAGYKFFQTGNTKVLKLSAVKKYFRLVFPILTAGIAIYTLMKLGLYQNSEAAAKAGTSVFFGNYNTFSPTLWGAVKESVWGCFVTGANQYNGPLWFIHYEFFGCLFVALFLLLFGKKKGRYILYVMLCALLVRSDFLAPVMGCIVADFVVYKPRWIEVLSQQKWLMWLLLIAGLYLCSYPPIGDHLEGTIYHWLTPRVFQYYILGSACVIYAVFALPVLQKLLSAKWLLKLSPLGYGVFLLHFPILCTFSSAYYLALADKVNYHVIGITNFVLSFVLILAVSQLLHHFVEKPGNALANMVAEKIVR